MGPTGRKTNKNIGTQWLHVSTAVNKAGWMLVDGSRIRQPDLVAFVGQLSGTAANVLSWIPSSLRTNLRCFYWFRILMHDHLLILTHITLTLQYIHDSIESTASKKQCTYTHNKQQQQQQQQQLNKENREKNHLFRCYRVPGCCTMKC